MALHTTIQVAIAGQMLPVVDSFTLNEAVGNHASFNIAVESEHLTSEEDANVNLLERSKNYLGEACTIQIEDNSDMGASNMQYKGIITHLHGYRDSNDGVIREMVMITGMSSSILLEGAQDTNSSLELAL